MQGHFCPSATWGFCGQTGQASLVTCQGQACLLVLLTGHRNGADSTAGARGKGLGEDSMAVSVPLMGPRLHADPLAQRLPGQRLDFCECTGSCMFRLGVCSRDPAPNWGMLR